MLRIQFGGRSRLLATVAIFPLSLGSALAQSASTPNTAPPETVVVTGTSIHGVAPIGSPLIGITAEDIETSPVGATGDTEDLLRQLPQISGLGPGDTHTNAVQGAQQNVDYGNAINLRGIGPDATLLLVNGNRIALSGGKGTFFDPDVIAPDAIERVEVLADGASSVYGSDAVAGVVNLILRKDYDGARASFGYGFGDGFFQEKANALAGYSWTGGSVVLSGTYSDNSDLWGADRSYSTSNLTTFGGPNLQSPDAVPGNLTIGGVTYALPNTNGTALTPAQIAAGKGQLNNFDTSANSDIFPNEERIGFTGSLTQKLTDWLSVSLDGFWSRRNTSHWADVAVANQPITSANPFFVSPVPGLTSGTVDYNFANDVGPQKTEEAAVQFQSDLGLDFELPFDWHGKFTSSYGMENEGMDGSLFRNTNLFTASSNILTPLLNDPNPATALNILGNGTANNPATLQKLFIGENLFHFGSHLTNFVASFDGPVFSLPAGDVKLAVGAAYRIEQQMEDIGSNTGVLTNPLTLTFREQDRPPTRVVESLYAEVAIPLVSEKNSFFLFHKLDLSLSGRYDDYSDVGQTTNPKIGLDWVPVDDLKIHSSWSTSFRAPVVDQLLNNEAAGNAGVLAPVPGGQLFGIILTGGNPNLTPEKSRGDSLGADYNPSWLPGFGLSTNYFYVDFYSKIGQVAGSNGTPTILSTAAMQALYAPYINLNPTRAQVEAAYAANNAIPASTDPTLVKFIIDGRSNNIGISIIRGMDFTGHYFVPTDWGVFGVQESGIFYFQYLNSVLPGAPVFENINQINFPTKFTSKTQFSWDNGSGLHVGTFVTFMPPYLNNLISPSQKVSSYTQVDLQLNYQFAEGLSWIPDEASWLTDHAAISLSVLNLFNQTPPYVNNTTGLEYDPQNVTAEGRVVSIELVKKLW